MLKIKSKTQRKNERKRLKKKVVKAAITAVPALVTGHGNYVPSKFARVKGKGGYISDIATGLGQKVGSLIPALAGKAGSLFENLLGMGDYRERSKLAHKVYNKNSENLMSMVRGTTPTNPGSMNMGALNVQFNGGPPIIEHREFVGLVYPSTSFQTTVYRIQPGLKGTKVLFPWGSTVASCFQQYDLKGAIVEYKPTSSNYSATSALGTVMMSTNYDAEAVPFSTQIAVDNNEFTTSDMPCNCFIHPIECANSQQPINIRYVQSENSSSASNDERFNDVGIFQISTVGNDYDVVATGVPIGELWITYRIAFLKPQLPDLHAGTTAIISGVAYGGNWMNALMYNSQNSLPVIYGPANNTIFLPVGYAGTYMVSAVQAGSVASITRTSGMTFGSDVSWTQLYFDGASTPPDRAYVLNLNSATPDVFLGPLGMDSKIGQIDTYIITTIAESASNNYIVLPSFSGGDANNYSTVIITAVDNDMASGLQQTTPPSSYSSVYLRKNIAPRLREVEQELVELQRKLSSLISAKTPESKSKQVVLAENVSVSSCSYPVGTFTAGQNDDLATLSGPASAYLYGVLEASSLPAFCLDCEKVESNLKQLKSSISLLAQRVKEGDDGFLTELRLVNMTGLLTKGQALLDKHNGLKSIGPLVQIAIEPPVLSEATTPVSEGLYTKALGIALASLK